MKKEEEKEIACPWCGESIVPRVGSYQGQHGKVREERCPKCNKLLLTRLEGIPLTIVK